MKIKNELNHMVEWNRAPKTQTAAVVLSKVTPHYAQKKRPGNTVV